MIKTGRQKKPETLKKEREKLEKEIENLEIVMKEKKQQLDFQKTIESKQKLIKEDLKKQLEKKQEKPGEHFTDLIEDYIYLVGLKETLKLDIDLNGIRYKSTSGNGFSTYKPNESVKNLPLISTQMSKILDTLGLKEPVEGDGGDGGLL